MTGAPSLRTTCPPDHRVNMCRIVGNEGPMFGEFICGTCFTRGRVDWTFAVHATGERREFWERVNGQWRQVKREADLVWEN